VNGVQYTWDNNGNLINDGTNTYAYDSANRLTSVTQDTNTYTFAYSGIGDRLSQTADGVVTTYTLDLNARLTQVLVDGTNTYLYGVSRIGEQQPGGFAYHLPDALGSVRQLANASGVVTLARSYEPYGNVLSSAGSGSSVFAFTGEQYDASTGLTYLRARYYASTQGCFFVRDPWTGNVQQPATLNSYLYVLGNPTNYTDPSGHRPCDDVDENGQCITESGWNITPPQPNLTPAGSSFAHDPPYGGVEVKALYEMMVAETSGWCYSTGEFTLETFFGLMLVHEAAGSAEYAPQIARAAAQQLYVGGNRDPYCPSSLCVQGAFNFLAAYSESVQRLVDTFVRGSTPITKYNGYGQFALKGEVIIQQKLKEATAWGNQALHPASLIYDRYNAPTDWGNFGDVNRALTKMGAQIGTGRNQVYYRSADRVFYVMTALQVNYWNGVVGK